MRKKMHIFFTAVLLITFTIQANAPSVLWVKEYGGYGWCYGESVVQTSDGGFIVAGIKEVFKTSKENNSDVWRVYVVRTDSNGDTLWAREYGGEDDDKGYSILNTNDGCFIIAGVTTSSAVNKNFEFYLIRIDSKGDTLWTRTYGTKKNERAYSVDLTKDGGYILAGETDSIDPPGPSVYLVRTDSAGDTLWTKTYAFTGDTISCANSVIQTNDGGFAVAGRIKGGEWGLFMRTDSSGELLVKKIFTMPSLNTESVGLRDLKQTSDGGFIISGQITITMPVGYEQKLLLIRTDPNGDTLWTKTYNDGYRGYSVDVTEDDGFIVSSSSGEETFIIRTDSNGDSLWAINSKEYDWKGWLKSIKQTEDGGFIAAGEGSADTTGGVNFILVRIDKDTTEIQKESPHDFEMIEGYDISYNHKENILYINYNIPYSCNAKLNVYDTHGRLVKVLFDNFQSKGSHTIKWNTRRDRRKLAAGGVYFLKLSANGHTVSKKVPIVK